jgi:hypothetical protein
VILSNFRRTRTVPYSSSYQTQTAPNYFYNKTRVRGVESNYRTIIKNLELFLKTSVFLKKKHLKKYLKIRIILWYFFKKILVFKNNSKFLIIVR